MAYYANSNRAGKLLAQALREHRYKTKIPYIIHPGTNQKEKESPKNKRTIYSSGDSQNYRLSASKQISWPWLLQQRIL